MYMSLSDYYDVPKPLRKLGNLKCYPADLARDFIKIYRVHLQRYKEEVPYESKEYIKECINDLKELHLESNVVNTYRVYLVTSMEKIRLMLYNIDKCVVEQLKKVLADNDKRATYDWYHADAELVSTVYIFEGARLTFQCDLFPDDALGLTMAFHKENMFDYSIAREVLFLAPRRSVREKRKEN